VLVLVLLLPELVMAAQCRVGEVVRLVGEVSVVRPARQFVPVIGMQICMGDRFVTGGASIAELRLRDGSLDHGGQKQRFHGA
jgi:hypothetical protein